MGRGVDTTVRREAVGIYIQPSVYRIIVAKHHSTHNSPLNFDLTLHLKQRTKPFKITITAPKK